MARGYGCMKLDAAWRMIRRIRNPDKREYAIRYLEWLRGIGREPEERDMGVSCMAAQGVRMELYGIWHSRDA